MNNIKNMKAFVKSQSDVFKQVSCQVFDQSSNAPAYWGYGAMAWGYWKTGLAKVAKAAWDSGLIPQDGIDICAYGQSIPTLDFSLMTGYADDPDKFRKSEFAKKYMPNTLLSILSYWTGLSECELKTLAVYEREFKSIEIEKNNEIMFRLPITEYMADVFDKLPVLDDIYSDYEETVGRAFTNDKHPQYTKAFIEWLDKNIGNVQTYVHYHNSQSQNSAYMGDVIYFAFFIERDVDKVTVSGNEYDLSGLPKDFTVYGISIDGGRFYFYTPRDSMDYPVSDGLLFLSNITMMCGECVWESVDAGYSWHIEYGECPNEWRSFKMSDVEIPTRETSDGFHIKDDNLHFAGSPVEVCSS